MSQPPAPDPAAGAVQMATFVAQAIFKTADPIGDWEELEEAEKQEFLLIAYAAIGAHDAWLMTNGYAIRRLKANPASRLVTPAKPKLIGLH